MASPTSLAIVFSFWIVFWCLQLLHAGEVKKPPRVRGRVATLAASALLPTVLATFGLALLLLFAHVRALGRRANAAGGGGGARSLGRLVKATLAAAAAAALLAGALLAADDVEWQ